MSHLPTPGRRVLATASTLVLLGSLAACGGGSDGADRGSDTTSAQAQGSPQGGGGFAPPGASGQIAAVEGTTMQVQSQQNGQVAVSWTGKTTITAEVSGTLKDVTVGSCVRVVGTGTPVEATQVTVTQPSEDGSCDLGFGGGGGGRPPGGMPSDAPSGAPSGGPGGGAGGFGGAFGQVTKVGDDGFTVSGSMPGEDSTAETEVSVGDQTTYTTTQEADASAIEVGGCAFAQGDSDDTGAVAATSIRLSDPVDGQCGGGLGGGGLPGAPDQQESPS